MSIWDDKWSQKTLGECEMGETKTKNDKREMFNVPARSQNQPHAQAR